MSFAPATSKSPVSEKSMSAKNSPASCPKCSELLPVASSLVGHASSVSRMPMPSVISLMYCVNSPTRSVPYAAVSPSCWVGPPTVVTK